MISETKSNVIDAQRRDALRYDQAVIGMNVGTDDDDSFNYGIFINTNNLTAKWIVFR